MTELRFANAPREHFLARFGRLTGTSLLLIASSFGCSTEVAPTASEGDFASNEFDQALGECTSTSQCKSMYGERAVDCVRSGGGFCVCGPGRDECAVSTSAVPPASGTGASCRNDAACPSDHYCNVNQGKICTPDRAAGAACSRNAQCAETCSDRTCSGTAGGGNPSKPNVWILSDMSDPSLNANDPDDVVAMAMYLLNANRFNTASITVASTHRTALRGAPNQATWAKNYLGAAYDKGRTCLESSFAGYQSSIPWRLSSLSTGTSARKFSASNDYSDLSSLSTVQALVDYARSNQVFVLVWGPITEASMAIKHLITKGDTAALKNITVISHWHQSYIAQGLERSNDKFDVANCQDDRAACDYIHNLAATNSNVKYYDLGSVGQGGIVSGSPSNYPWNDFRDSSLGTIFRDAKFAFGKPDGSDAATFYALMGDYGVKLSDLLSNGTLTKSLEESTLAKFKSSAPRLIDDLLARSDAAAACE